MQHRQAVRVLATFLILLSVPAVAYAHLGGAPQISFTEGFAHPLGGLDHLLAMTAVGLWSGQLGGRTVWLAPLGFMSFMAIGGTIGMAGMPFPFVEQGIIASIIVFGVLVTMGTRPPVWLGMAAVAAFAVFHGYAHGAEMPESESAVFYVAGFVIATGLLHLAGIALAEGLERAKLHVAVQGLGGAVVACGLLLMAF